MRSAVDGVDVVCKGEQCFRPRVTLILEGNFNAGRALHSFDVDRAIMCDLALAIEMSHKRDDATLEVEGCFAIGTIVDQRHPETLVQIRGFAQTIRERLK